MTPSCENENSGWVKLEASLKTCVRLRLVENFCLVAGLVEIGWVGWRWLAISALLERQTDQRQLTLPSRPSSYQTDKTKPEKKLTTPKSNAHSLEPFRYGWKLLIPKQKFLYQKEWRLILESNKYPNEIYMGNCLTNTKGICEIILRGFVKLMTYSFDLSVIPTSENSWHFRHSVSWTWS